MILATKTATWNIRKNTEAKIGTTMKTIKTKRYKVFFAIALSFALAAVVLAGCGSGAKYTSESADAPSAENNGGDIVQEGTEGIEPEPAKTDKESIDMSNSVIQITMEGGGVITIALDPEAAPITTANFLKLVDEEFYDGLTFHRIILNFMIQGGDPDGTGTGGLSEKIKGEFSANGWDNPISHKRGVISMARTPDRNSASCQFFITNADALSLDGEYAAFGVVTSGMEVVDEISAVDTDRNDRPLEPVVIKTIRRK
jgi:peptidyl-prolyl cis-trans isomerase B (cyclophilin B)